MTSADIGRRPGGARKPSRRRCPSSSRRHAPQPSGTSGWAVSPTAVTAESRLSNTAPTAGGRGERGGGKRPRGPSPWGLGGGVGRPIGKAAGGGKRGVSVGG